MLNRRIKGIESKIEQKVAKELRQKVTMELDGLRQSVLTAENKANAAVLAKDNYMERVVKLEEDLALYKTELGDQFESLLKAKMEAEKARNELEKQQRITDRARQAKETADAAVGELTKTVSELRQQNQSLTSERDALLCQKGAMEGQVCVCSPLRYFRCAQPTVAARGKARGRKVWGQN